jgi:alkanesulfonate monooxygenase SsuD/methylene tetrahydromethanopterin reductase-like flavin-dependent oxidoreductase (luciferase family)
LGDGAITTAESPQRFAAWRANLDKLRGEYGKSGNVPKLLFASFRIGHDGSQTREEGWAWMESFFRRSRQDLQGTFTPVFGTAEECTAQLERYRAAGMTGIIARIASDDDEGQSELLVKALKPALQ